MQKFDSSEKSMKMLFTCQGENGKISKTSHFTNGNQNGIKYSKN